MTNEKANKRKKKVVCAMLVFFLSFYGVLATLFMTGSVSLPVG